MSRSEPSARRLATLAVLAAVVGVLPAGVPAETARAAPAVAVRSDAAPEAALPNGLRKEVFGFLPYWTLDAADLQWMRYDLLSTIAYFGIPARSDGTLGMNTSGGNGWLSSAMTAVISAAHAKGVKVVLTVTMMATDGGAQQGALLGNATARTNLINAIVATVRDRHADGVNLDFEPVYTAQKAQYTAFVRQLKAALVAGGVGSYLTVCTTGGAASWATGYDVPGLVAAGAADAIFVMGYDYSWSGSARAGGVAPMSSPYMLDVSDSVNDFLKLVPGSKLIWGAPYYGRTWRTTSNVLNAATAAGASSTSAAYWYAGNLNLAASYGRLWDSVGKVPWFRYYDSGAASWVEGYYEDAESLAYKWDMVNQRGLAGAGVWHLLMDQGRSELWNLIANRFKTDTSPPTGGIAVLPSAVDGLGTPVTWHAIDVGSGVASYTIQARDRAEPTWTTWLSNTTATGATWTGLAGHSYEFRVSAVDTRGNRQPWVAEMVDPAPTLATGGFGQVATDALNVRSGAGTTFGVLDVLGSGDRVALVNGPIANGGYDWYEVQFDFAEWPSAEYPRIGWVAAGSGGTPYVVPSVAPTVTTLQPALTAYDAQPRVFSPNGDGVVDATGVTFNLPEAASGVTLDVMDASGAVVRTEVLGALPGGPAATTWDGHLASAGGPWAPEGRYLLRISANLTDGTHVAPMATVDGNGLAAWGVTADLTGPAVVGRAPDGSTTSLSPVVSATLSEPVTGVNPASIQVTDLMTDASVPGTVTGGGSQVSFAPAGALVFGHLFQVSIGTGMADLVGNQMTPAGWTFATAPANGRVVRLSGGDRYATAAAISAATFEPGVSSVFVANGTSFADSLAGAATAAVQDAPLLLVAASGVPASTASELARLHPGRVYVLGGPSVISDATAAALGSFTTPAGSVTRLAGPDRYATAATISSAFTAPEVPLVLVATGENFPDGLTAGPAAGATGAPLLLVRRDSVPPPTAAELARLGPARIAIIGSSGVVSDAVAATLAGFATSGVERIAGPDRYATAAAVSARFFDVGSRAAYVATGEDFPDALAAGPAAAHLGGPLLPVRVSSLPAGVMAELARLHPRVILIAGGPAVVAPAVQQALTGFAGP